MSVTVGQEFYVADAYEKKPPKHDKNFRMAMKLAFRRTENLHRCRLGRPKVEIYFDEKRGYWIKEATAKVVAA